MRYGTPLALVLATVSPALALPWSAHGPTAGMGAMVIRCEAVPEPVTGQVCAVTPRGGALLIKGTVLGIDRVYRGERSSSIRRA